MANRLLTLAEVTEDIARCWQKHAREADEDDLFCVWRRLDEFVPAPDDAVTQTLKSAMITAIAARIDQDCKVDADG